MRRLHLWAGFSETSFWVVSGRKWEEFRELGPGKAGTGSGGPMTANIQIPTGTVNRESCEDLSFVGFLLKRASHKSRTSVFW